MLALVVIDYVLVAPNVLGTFFFGKLTIILYWFLQMFFWRPANCLSLLPLYPTRARQSRRASPILMLGRAADAEVLMRAIESGAVKKIWPVGILSPSPADQGQMMRGVGVLGGFDDLEQVIARGRARAAGPVRVLTPSALEPQAHPEDPDQGAAARSRPNGCRRSTRAARRCAWRR